MNDLPRRVLREIVEQYGHAVLDDPRRCRALLFDLCGEHKREIFVLVSALEEHVPQDLQAAADMVPLVILLKQLAERLRDNLALAENAANWAVISWAKALGMSVPQQILTPSPSSPPLPPESKSAPPNTTPHNFPTPPTRTVSRSNGHIFTSTQRADVLTRNPTVIGEDWKLKGTTPGQVPIPPSHHVRLRAYNLDNTALATLVSEIKAFGPVEELDLRENPRITDTGVDSLRDLKNLKALNLSRAQVSNTGLNRLQSLRNLRSLDLAWCNLINDEGLAHLHPLSHLTHLDLSWCSHITDEGLAHLRVLTSLTSLNLEGCKQVSNKGLRYLTRLTNLASLNLSQCSQVTNAGLRHIDSLPRLTSLYLYGCRSVNRAVTLLKKKNPALYVFR